MVQAGENVTFVDPWPEHVEHMRKHQLRVTHAMNVLSSRFPAGAAYHGRSSSAKEKPVDIAFVCMKSYDTAWATMMIPQYLSPNGYVVSLQNSMNEETIAGIVGWVKTLRLHRQLDHGRLPDPGRIHRDVGKHGAAHTVFRAGEVHGRVTPRARRSAGSSAPPTVPRSRDDLWGERWSKLVANVMGNGLSACAGLPGAVADEPIRRFGVRLEAKPSASGRRSAMRSRKCCTCHPIPSRRAGEGDDGHKERLCRQPGQGRREDLSRAAPPWVRT